MTVAYEETGRTAQKQRTRDALVAAARSLLGEGIAPTIEQAAKAASVSRATAYRYFPDRSTLLAAAYPRMEARSLLGEDPPHEPGERLAIVLQDLGRQIVAHETELRATWRVALDASVEQDRIPLRAGRAIGWIEDALEPLRRDRSAADVRRLAVAIRACFGIEAFVWLVDVAGLDRDEAISVMAENACARLRHGPGR